MTIESKKVRVRFPPSPTGFLHIGSLRTALYNYLFARQNKGDFILRIEDTDRSRYVEGAVENLIKVLDKMGLEYNEGPIIKESEGNGRELAIGEKGDYSPYVQSKRLPIYREYLQKLIDDGHAYHCFCTSERLEEMRKEQEARHEAPRYDGRCRHFSKEEADEKIKQGEPYVVRLKVPREGTVKFADLIRGEIEFQWKNIDDQVLLKSDGYPTYHLAVIDDHLMGITHVIRGEEWLSSVPKYILLYEDFGWDVPEFAHLPLLLNAEKKKLSKREGDVAVEDFLAKGYLPEALINFVALLGWNPGTDEEIFSLEELVGRFSLEQVQKSGAVFNLEKLDWINGSYIRKMDANELTERCLPYLEAAGLIKIYEKNRIMITDLEEEADFDYLIKIVALEQERLKKLSEISELTGFFFTDKLNYDPALLVWKKMSKEDLIKNLSAAKKALMATESGKFDRKNLEGVLMALATKTGTGELLWPLRVAMTGLKGSPGPFEVAEILGKERVIRRIEAAILSIS